VSYCHTSPVGLYLGGVGQLVWELESPFLLAASHCPRREARDIQNGPLEAAMIQSVRKILAPIDFSEPSMKALASAWELAKEVDAVEMHLLYVVTPHHLLGIEALPVGGREIAREASMIEQGDEELARIKKAELENSNKVIVATVVGSPAIKIGDYAREQGIDLIVMSTHGRTNADSMLVGGTTEKVIRHSTCAVLVIRR
jgi:nucleotide-binding universal stress UspA family protein